MDALKMNLPTRNTLNTKVGDLMCFTKLLLLLAVVSVSAAPARAISVEALAARLAAGERVTVVDVRSAMIYERAHIPGAINIPARLIEGKRIPALGEVVVVGDALDLDATRQASEALARRAGIQSDWLEGGFAAWRERGERFAGSAAVAGRLRGTSLPSTYIRYADVAHAARSNPGLVLVDLRRLANDGGAGPEAAAGRLEAIGEEALRSGELRDVPRVNARRPVQGASDDAKVLARVLGMAKQGPDRVFVLVDDGRGASEELARRLRAAGLHRVRILIGGGHELEDGGHAAPRTIESRQETGPPGRDARDRRGVAPRAGGLR